MIITFFSTLGLYVWLYEIVEIKTWFGLNRLNEQLYSPFLVALFSVSVFMAPFIVNKQQTIKINPGFGTGSGWVDAVKMGYPIFWISVLLGFSGLIISKQPFLNKIDL